MTLDIGSTITMDVLESDGSPLDLDDFHGKSNVFIYFMRALSCAQCNAAVRVLTTQQAEFEAAHVKVIVAVPEGADAAAAWKDKRAVPFPVIVGKTGTPHAEIGLLRKVFGTLQQSGGVLLDSTGAVRYAHVSTNPGASYNKAEVSAAIADLPPIG